MRLKRPFLPKIIITPVNAQFLRRTENYRKQADIALLLWFTPTAAISANRLMAISENYTTLI